MLSGSRLEDEWLDRVARHVSAVINPPSDTRASAEYRREVAGVVAVRALRQAWE
jgi:CO/xanthine dehydrogenase FAD-binding subunit